MFFFNYREFDRLFKENIMENNEFVSCIIVGGN